MTLQRRSDVFGLRQAAAYLGVVRSQLIAWSRAGQIGRQVAGAWLYQRSELDRWRQNWQRPGQSVPLPQRPQPTVARRTNPTTATADEAWLLQILADTGSHALTVAGWMAPVAASCHAAGWIHHQARQRWQITVLGRAALAEYKERMASAAAARPA